MGRGDVVRIRCLCLQVDESSFLCAGMVGCPYRTEIPLIGSPHPCGQVGLTGDD